MFSFYQSTNLTQYEQDLELEEFNSWSPPPTKKKHPRWKEGLIRYPQPKRAIRPRYPEFCKSSGAQGEVKVEFYVDETGNVDPESVAILNSVPCLDDEVVKAIKKSKWKPARQGKQKTGLWLEKSFEFKLS